VYFYLKVEYLAFVVFVADSFLFCLSAYTCSICVKHDAPVFIEVWNGVLCSVYVHVASREEEFCCSMTGACMRLKLE